MMTPADRELPYRGLFFPERAEHRAEHRRRFYDQQRPDQPAQDGEALHQAHGFAQHRPRQERAEDGVEEKDGHAVLDSEVRQGDVRQAERHGPDDAANRAQVPQRPVPHERLHGQARVSVVVWRGGVSAVDGAESHHAAKEASHEHHLHRRHVPLDRLGDDVLERQDERPTDHHRLAFRQAGQEARPPGRVRRRSRGSLSSRFGRTQQTSLLVVLVALFVRAGRRRVTRILALLAREGQRDFHQLHIPTSRPRARHPRCVGSSRTTRAPRAFSEMVTSRIYRISKLQSHETLFSRIYRL